MLQGTVRYTGITTGGIVEAAPLLELRLQALDPAAAGATDARAARPSELTVMAAFDLDGNALRPVIGSKEPAGPATDVSAHHPGGRRRRGR